MSGRLDAHYLGYMVTTTIPEIANQAFTEYAVNRLAVCSRGVFNLCSIIVEAGEEESVLTE